MKHAHQPRQLLLYLTVAYESTWCFQKSSIAIVIHARTMAVVLRAAVPTCVIASRGTAGLIVKQVGCRPLTELTQVP